MLLTIDIGNTDIKIGILDENKAISTHHLSAQEERSSDEYGILIQLLLKKDGILEEDIEGVIVSSTVPKLQSAFKRAISEYFKKDAVVIGPGIRTGISLRYDNPKEIGADRIVDAVAAHECYGGDCLVIDFGTATTFEYIDEKGVYKGGCITPGIEIAARALSLHAAKLPDIEITPTDKVIASDTTSSMQAGLFYGYVGQVEYLIDKFKEESGRQLKVIATGELGKEICRYTKKVDVYDPDLTFKGLRAIYEKNR